MKIIEAVKKSNPYPADIFPDLSDAELREISDILIKHGKSPDRLYAKWGRQVWDNCVKCMEYHTDSLYQPGAKIEVWK